MHHRGREVLGNAIHDNILSQRVHARSTGQSEEIARHLSSIEDPHYDGTLNIASPTREVIADGSVSATRRIYGFRGIGGRSAKARQAQPCGAGFPLRRGPA